MDYGGIKMKEMGVYLHFVVLAEDSRIWHVNIPLGSSADDSFLNWELCSLPAPDFVTDIN